MHAGLPDAHPLRFPGFDRSDRACLRRHARDVPAAARAGVLNNRHRMEIDDAGAQLAILGWWGRRAFPFSAAPWRIVKSPVFQLALSALHDHAADLVVALAIRQEVARWEMDVLPRHHQ